MFVYLLHQTLKKQKTMANTTTKLELTEQQMYEVVRNFIEDDKHSADRLREILLEIIDMTNDEQVIINIYRYWVK